ncbi:hypothetical protein [Novosphingobium sp. PASSN1]|uniref:hypothetical protein n=1 Tax=Novosphingobium sp. PASSN1 TaxID=2015561 RepID=UPI000BDA5984|nr:hypothetical protein [Novosphingobium sp. PASSN1]OYU34519.1 MAG: hypothetical protein CFE35_14060 [Novosphingobium sp. PASSN1]
MNHSPLAVLACTALLCTTAFSTPALARWETANGAAVPPGGQCAGPHTRNPDLRATDSRPFEVPAGFSNEIEIYGQGIDLSPSVAATGLPGLTATISRKISGPENAVRGCGAIGSVVLRIVTQPSVPAASGSLAIGAETFPLRIVNASISGDTWSDATMRRASAPAGTGSGGSAPASLLIITNGGTGCGPVNCPPGGGGATSFGSSGTTALTRTPDYPSGIGECIDDFGGSAAFSGGNSVARPTLTLVLPRARGANELACLVRPAIFEVTGTAARGDVGGFQGGADYRYPGFNRTVLPPRYTGTTSGLIGPAPLPLPDAQVQVITMTRETAATFVGERTITLSSPVPGTGRLSLVLRSDPRNGIRTIQGLPFSGARLTSRIDVRFDFLAALRAGGEAIAWRIQPISLGAPDTCFTAASGTATVTAPVGTLTLTATEIAGCVGARFALSIAPQAQGAGVFAAPYAQTVLFTLPARSPPAPIVPPQLGTSSRP